MPEPWVSFDEVANHLGVVKDTVYRWIGQKGLPALRGGRLWNFRRPEAENWGHEGRDAVARRDHE